MFTNCVQHDAASEKWLFGIYCHVPKRPTSTPPTHPLRCGARAWSIGQRPLCTCELRRLCRDGRATRRLSRPQNPGSPDRLGHSLGRDRHAFVAGHADLQVRRLPTRSVASRGASAGTPDSQSFPTGFIAARRDCCAGGFHLGLLGGLFGDFRWFSASSGTPAQIVCDGRRRCCARTNHCVSACAA